MCPICGHCTIKYTSSITYCPYCHIQFRELKYFVKGSLNGLQ